MAICYMLLLFSHSVVFDSLWPHGLQHNRHPCPLPSPGACWNSRSLGWSNRLVQPSCPSLSPSPPAFNLSSIRYFSNELTLRMRWPKYWSFSISSSNEYSGLISFRIDCFDFLAVQGTLKSLLQLHSSKASILQCSVFFMVQLSYPYMVTGKTIALTRRTFVGRVICCIANVHIEDQ